MDLSTYGGAVGSLGVAGGDLLLAAGKGVLGGGLNSSGVPGSAPTAVPSGNITVTTSAGDISIDSVSSYGSYYGGNAGNVALEATGGALHVGYIDIGGGEGSSGPGGNAGTLVASGATGVDLGNIKLLSRRS